ncbi:MAG: metalloprotease TldD [Candidatus Symbiodolus clandestinus]
MSVSTVSEQLLIPYGLTQQQLVTSLTLLSEHAIDYADLYCQASWHEQWVIEERLIKHGAYHIDQGIGARAVRGEAMGFAYADQLNLTALQQSARAAGCITQDKGIGAVQALISQKVPSYYPATNPLRLWSSEQKIALLQQIDQVARQADPRVCQVTATLDGLYELILVAATDGTLAADQRPLVRLSITLLVEQQGRRERGSAGGGGRCSYDYFLQPVDGISRAESYAQEAVRQALVNLTAIPAPAGTLPVVLGPGWPGVLLHEAVGHGLEGDFNRKGASVFSGRLGGRVASPLCTVIDDGTLAERRGSLTIDDEGTPSQRTVLIEQGVLKGYLQDKLNARLMGGSSTGNGRRESYAHLPMPRMTNTYLQPGQQSPQAIIESVDYGIYAPHFSGGQVDITSGNFVFSTAEAYLIEQGRLTKPVKGATLIGSGIETMQKISMVGNDLALDPGIGVCGKAGQMVPVGVGQPTIKVEAMTVGGAA